MSKQSLDVALHYLPEREAEAKRLAQSFNLPLANNAGKTRYKLWLGALRLELIDSSAGAPGPVYVDFTEGRAHYRRLYGGGKNQPLARAVGIKEQLKPYIIDATAGLGRDAFVLACLGCQITLIERSPVLAMLLHDGLERAKLNTETATIADNMQLIHSDARSYLDTLSETVQPDTIYLDPMYPHRNKSALVKKEMRITRDIVGDDEDANALLATALEKTKKRVTVKRPSHAGLLSKHKPTTAIKSKNTRYDIYIVNQIRHQK